MNGPQFVTGALGSFLPDTRVVDAVHVASSVFGESIERPNHVILFTVALHYRGRSTTGLQSLVNCIRRGAGAGVQISNLPASSLCLTS
jgi:hypothetical protein